MPYSHIMEFDVWKDMEIKEAIFARKWKRMMDRKFGKQESGIEG